MLSFVVWLFHMLLSLFVPASLWIFFFFKQKTAYEMRISDWSSDVCSSDLHFFSRQDGQIYTVASIYRWFRKILYRAGISHGGIGTGPRIHDFRHTFACHSLAQMSRAGLDLYYSLPLDRKSVVEGKSVSVRVDLGGRRFLKKKKIKQKN